MAGTFLIALFPLYFYLRGCAKRQDAQTSMPVLAKGEAAKVIVDPLKHSLTVITPGHVKTVNLPNRPSSIVLLTGDGLKVVAPAFGPEIRPWLGAVWSPDGGKVLGGLDLFYWRLLDLGLGVAINPKYVQDTRIFIGASYVVWANTSVVLAIDNQKTPMVGIKVWF